VGTVSRPEYVKVKAYNEKMEEYTMEGTGLLARAFCHEIDHLDGKLYVDQTIGELRDVLVTEEIQ
jgi:peptide deformylase